VRKVSRRGPLRPTSPDRVRPAAATSSPPLRLVGSSAPDAKPPIANPTPIRGATDPRWVLAVRTATLLEGAVLTPNKREALMRTGKVMGLSPFDCSLILAIVQDRARRGVAPDQCPSAGQAQLALIPLPPMRSVWSRITDMSSHSVMLAAGLLALQALLIWAWLG